MEENKDQQEELLDKGYSEDSLSEIPPVMEVQPTLRARFWELFICGAVCMFFVMTLKKVPTYGVYLDTLLGFNLKLLHIKISYGMMAWPLRIGALVSFFYGVFIVIQQKTTTYQLNDLNLIFTRGVFTRTSDSTDLVSIRDHKVKSTLHDRILGISRLKILSKDVSDPEMDINGITKQEAQSIINFLRRYAYQNYTEMRLAQEKAKMRKNRQRKNRIDDALGFSDDGGDGE